MDSNAHQIAADALGGREALSVRLRAPAGAIVMSRPLPPGGRRTAITAAAQVYNPRTKKDIQRNIKRPPRDEWAAEVWVLRDETGELRFIGDRQARACSQVRIFIGVKDDPLAEPVPLTDGAPAAAVELNKSLFGNYARVEQQLKRASQHIIYVGESWIIVAEGDDGGLAWEARSGTELIGGNDGRWKLSDGVQKPRDLGTNEVVIRAWNPHPEYMGRADSPVRAVIPAARELRGLTQYVGAQIDSRLAGAGLLLLPQGIESAFSRDPDTPEDYTFGDELADYMVVPIQDRASAGSVVPFMAMVPPELVDKVQHITFNSPLDGQAQSLREEAIRRIGLGMDSDPSVLLGQAASNHWSAWSVDENEVKFGVVPVVSTICHALTVGLVQPLLKSAGIDDSERYQVWYDETVLQVRPDRSKDAQALYDKQVISREVLRRENGFADDDAPDDKEREETLLLELLRSVPNYAPQILPLLGVEVPGITDQPAPETPPKTQPLDPKEPGEGVAEEAPDGPPVQGDVEAPER